MGPTKGRKPLGPCNAPLKTCLLSLYSARLLFPLRVTLMSLLERVCPLQVSLHPEFRHVTTVCTMLLCVTQQLKLSSEGVCFASQTDWKALDIKDRVSDFFTPFTTDVWFYRLGLWGGTTKWPKATDDCLEPHTATVSDTDFQVVRLCWGSRAGSHLPCRMEGVPKKAVSKMNIILMQYFKINAIYP